MNFEADLNATLALNPGWTLRWEPALVDGEHVCRVQNDETREEVNGNDAVSRERAMEILLVRMELSGRFEMPEVDGYFEDGRPLEDTMTTEQINDLLNWACDSHDWLHEREGFDGEEFADACGISDRSLSHVEVAELILEYVMGG
jgi:hypothetical protein